MSLLPCSRRNCRQPACARLTLSNRQNPGHGVIVEARPARSRTRRPATACARRWPSRSCCRWRANRKGWSSSRRPCPATWRRGWERRLVRLGVCLERGQCRERRLRVVSCMAKIVKCGTKQSGPQTFRSAGSVVATPEGSKRMQVAQAVQAITAHAALSCRDCRRRFGLERKISTEYCPKTKAPSQVNLAGAFIFRLTP